MGLDLGVLFLEGEDEDCCSIVGLVREGEKEASQLVRLTFNAGLLAVI